MYGFLLDFWTFLPGQPSGNLVLVAFKRESQLFNGAGPAQETAGTVTWGTPLCSMALHFSPGILTWCSTLAALMLSDSPRCSALRALLFELSMMTLAHIQGCAELQNNCLAGYISLCATSAILLRFQGLNLARERGVEHGLLSKLEKIKANDVMGTESPRREKKRQKYRCNPGHSWNPECARSLNFSWFALSCVRSVANICVKAALLKLQRS